MYTYYAKDYQAELENILFESIFFNKINTFWHLLTRKGISPNCKYHGLSEYNLELFSPIELAIHKGRKKMLTLLIYFGADTKFNLFNGILLTPQDAFLHRNWPIRKRHLDIKGWVFLAENPQIIKLIVHLYNMPKKKIPEKILILNHALDIPYEIYQQCLDKYYCLCQSKLVKIPTFKEIIGANLIHQMIIENATKSYNRRYSFNRLPQLNEHI